MLLYTLRLSNIFIPCHLLQELCYYQSHWRLSLPNNITFSNTVITAAECGLMRMAHALKANSFLWFALG